MAETRKLAAILAADVAGYSRLAGADEDRTLARLRALRSDLIDPTIAVHHGRVVKRTGDGILIEFRSVVDAVRCAIEVQNGMVERNAGLPPERRIEFRCGIHLGDVVEESDGDLMGDGVNIAARLEGIAKPGTICLSEDAYRQVKGRLDLAVSDLGPTELKNIVDPVRVYSLQVGVPAQAKPIKATAPMQRFIFALLAAGVVALIVIAGGAWYLLSANRTAAVATPTPAEAAHLSIVVLPFANLSNDPNQDYFADGLTEDLTNALGHIPESFVISSNTALTYKGKSIDVRQISRELGVRYALEGNIQKLGDTVRVNAQLINAETGGQIWADQFNGDVTRLPDLHDEVKGRVARSLNNALLAEEGRRSQRRPDNRDAVGLTFQARAILSRGLSPKGNAEARKLYDQALEISPDYLPALIGRAGTDVIEDLYFHGTIPLDMAEQILTRAMEVEPDDVRAKMTMILLYYFKGDMDRTAFFAEQTIAIDPSYAPGYASLGRARMAQGRATDAIALEEKAIHLSPRDPFVDLWYQNLGLTYLYLGRDEEAVPWLEKAVAMNDKVWSYHKDLASAYALTGRLDAAHKEIEATLRLFPGYTIAKSAAALRKLSSNETYQKQIDHYVDGMRLAGMPEN